MFRRIAPIAMLRYSIAIIYIWFGALKFFQGYSPAEQIAKLTIRCLTFGLIPDKTALLLLACWECAIGLLLLLSKWRNFAIGLLVVHLVLTFSPFILFPKETFLAAPYGFTMLGQYIFKNICLICAARVIWCDTNEPGTTSLAYSTPSKQSYTDTPNT